MARKLLELDTEDGGTILVAVEVPEEAVGQVASMGELPIERVSKSFDRVRDLVIRGFRPLTQAFKRLQLETQATSAQVELGVNFSASGDIYVVEASGEASLKITVTWDLTKSEQS
ncbi:MAG TPA: hypothetical protein DDZ80_07090 [Cyanobacteria bacterium UBA8803]|nr:hypothetical protein [Cyanobacteria bacterium UBA8803]